MQVGKKKHGSACVDRKGKVWRGTCQQAGKAAARNVKICRKMSKNDNEREVRRQVGSRVLKEKIRFVLKNRIKLFIIVISSPR